jgi:hypothetical protein
MPLVCRSHKCAVDRGCDSSPHGDGTQPFHVRGAPVLDDDQAPKARQRPAPHILQAGQLWQISGGL